MKTTSLYVNNILYNKLNTDLSDLAVLERAVNEFSFQSTYLHELYSGDIKIDDASIRIERTLKSLVDEVFILSLTRKIHQSILCCLRTYVSLNQQRQAELIYSEKIIEPVLSKIFTNKNLERHNHNLNLLYSEALQFLNSDVKSLVDLVRTNSGLKDFNFIVNSYWKIANKLLQDNLPHITAPGNPELFQKRFQDTWEFLTTIAGKVDPSLIYEESFQEHMKRFNLPVYFEIRFQQISASFETDIIENSFQTTNEHGFLKLKVSVACWRSIQHCFHPEVFLAHLSDQFIKLSLLLLSRYLYYVDAAIKNEQQPMKEEYIVHLILDMGNLKKLLGLQREGDVSRSIYKIVPKDLWIFIEQIIKSNDKLLDTASEKLTNYLIDYKVEQSATLLQQISAIPRLYRRTNKFAPTEESNYIRNVVLPLENFHKNNQALLTSNIDNIMDRCVNKISQQYMTLVEEVLRSVCKTEESLRRLKSRNVSTMDDPSAKSDLTSDEAKIREQIKLDVKYFVTHVSNNKKKFNIFRLILIFLTDGSFCIRKR